MTTGPTTTQDINRLRDGIKQALRLESERLDAGTIADAFALLDKTESRMGLGVDRTVVAFAGSTGSGKSSLFNAVSGLEIAQVGVRRPTTSKPTACVWGSGGEEFLTWLGVPVDNRTWRESALDGKDEEPLRGLILLDLPDHDSTADDHRFEADRLVGMVDMVVWVVDPQKYADFSIHSRYLRRLAKYTDNMLVVLNQVDRLAPEHREATADHLRSLLEADGIENPHVKLVSAVTREGVPQLRDELVRVVASKDASVRRLYTDMRGMADKIQAQLGTPVDNPDELAGTQRLLDAMTEAAGVDAVADTVRADYLRRSYRQTGYPLLAWAQRGKADPLGARHGGDRDDLVAASRPETTRTQSARVNLAAHDLVAEVTAGLPHAWKQAIGRAEKQSTAELTHTLDEAVTSVGIDLVRPGWWGLAKFFQVVFFVLTLLGIAWLVLNGVVIALALNVVFFDPSDPMMWIIPAGLLVVGAVGSVVTSSLAASARARGADKQAKRVRADLVSAVHKAAEGSYLEPIAAVLRQHKAVHDALN